MILLVLHSHIVGFMLFSCRASLSSPSEFYGMCPPPPPAVKPRWVMCGSRGGGAGDRTPLENYKNIGFLSNTGPDHHKITKLPIQHSTLGHHRPASEKPLKFAVHWRAVNGQLTVFFGSSHPLIKKKQNKKNVKVGPLWQNFLNPRLNEHKEDIRDDPS